MCVDDLRSLEGTAPPDHRDKRWDATRVAADSALTLAAGRLEPGRAGAAMAMHGRIVRQVAWRRA